MLQKEMKLRDKLVSTYKVFEEKRMEEQREKLRKAIEGKKRVSAACICFRTRTSVFAVL